MSAWGLERGRQTRGRRKARERRKGNRGKKKKEQQETREMRDKKSKEAKESELSLEGTFKGAHVTQLMGERQLETGDDVTPFCG